MKTIKKPQKASKANYLGFNASDFAKSYLREHRELMIKLARLEESSAASKA